MTGRDDVRVWIQLIDFVEKLQSCFKVPVRLQQLVFYALLVTSVCRGHTIANLAPKVRTLLTTAARAKQIVVIFVTSRCAITLEHGYRGSFDGQDDSGVGVIAEDVASDSTVLPSKRNRVGIIIAYIEPFRVIAIWFVRIFRHVGEVQNGLLVLDVWSHDVLWVPYGRHRFLLRGIAL